PFVHSGFRNMSYTRMTVWGEGFAQILRPFNPDQALVITGHHQLPATRLHSSPAIRGNHCAIGFFLQAPGRLISEASFSAFVSLIAATAEAFPDTGILVREHPAQALSTDQRGMLRSNRNLEFVDPATHALSDVLPRIGVAVSIYSTLTLVSIARGIVRVI